MVILLHKLANGPILFLGCVSLENYMVTGETLFHCCLTNWESGGRGAVTMANHCCEDHGASIDISVKFKLKKLLCCCQCFILC